ncbi:MAG TPA: exosome complex RNA-binding protein Rrp4 [Candidatus Nanoarchaeia archaeon]|nr:exosome complex RNA-binding protein Rrp4 [Candidatus Nanoarchaeia archaeon]
MGLLVKEKEIVIPGEVVADGDSKPSYGTYKDGDKLYSAFLGLVETNEGYVKIIPLSGCYLPKVDDKIIGRVIDILMTGWRMDTNSAYSAVLSVKEFATSRYGGREDDLSRLIAIGEYVYVRIIKVTSQNLIDLSTAEPGLGKLKGGRVITINSHKVPRVIGKKGSMVTLIKEKTGADIKVGQNGVIWIRAENLDAELKAEQAIRLIEEKAHTEGLTQTVEAFLQ